MKIHIALYETLRTFKPRLNATEIANRANVSQAAISHFRRGERDLCAGTLQRTINAPPEDIKQHFFRRLFDMPVSPVWSSALEPKAFVEISSAMSFSNIGQVLTEAGKNTMSAGSVSKLMGHQSAIPRSDQSKLVAMHPNHVLQRRSFANQLLSSSGE